MPTIWVTGECHYDLQSGRYQVQYLDNEERETFRFDKKVDEKNLTTGALRRAGRR